MTNENGVSEENDEVSASLTARYEKLGKEGRQFALRLNLSDNFLQKVLDGDDWTFCILCASMVEAALNELLVGGLKYEFGKLVISGSELSDFIERLPMLGRNGRHALAKAIGLSKGHLDFIEALFVIRNAYAHRLNGISKSVYDLVMNHPDGERLLRKLNLVFGEGGAELFAASVKGKPELLRLAIIDSVLQICAIANVIAHRDLPNQVTD